MKRVIVSTLEILACLPILILLVLGHPFLVAYLAADTLGRKWRVV